MPGFAGLFGIPKPKKYTRETIRAERPASYRWWKHVALLASLSTATIVVCALNLHAVQRWEWVLFGGALLFANFGEYWLHRIPFHNPVVPDFQYWEHTMIHHAFFSYERMSVDDLNDLRWVMFAPWVMPILLVAPLPIFALLYHFVSPNVAWLYLMAVIVYYSIYEVTHALAHMPQDSALGGSWIVQRISHHHRVHHDPRLMRRYNFNFAIPLFDWIFGTKYPDAAYAAMRAGAARGGRRDQAAIEAARAAAG